jgi:hypothetical protein
VLGGLNRWFDFSLNGVETASRCASESMSFYFGGSVIVGSGIRRMYISRAKTLL